MHDEWTPHPVSVLENGNCLVSVFILGVKLNQLCAIMQYNCTNSKIFFKFLFPILFFF